MKINETTVLAIDIGNTRTHIAVVDTAEFSCIDRSDFNNTDFGERFANTVKKLCSAYQINQINISSCVKKLKNDALTLCKDIGIYKVNEVKADSAAGIVFEYENPAQLGSDRVCNALACAALFKEENCVIICCGTAITIDFLHEGKIFEGGMIFAGTATHAAALCSQTDALPNVMLKNDESDADKYTMNEFKDAIRCASVISDTHTISGIPAIPAKSTRQCIAAGVLYATAGAVDRCIDEYIRLYGNNIRAVASGGGWELIKPLVKHSAKITALPNLTLIGAGIYSE